MKEGGYNGEIPVTSRRGMPLHGIIGPGLGRNEPASHGFSGGTRSCRGAASTRPSRPRQTARGTGRTRFGAVDRPPILPFFHMPKDVRLAAGGQRADRSDGTCSFPFWPSSASQGDVTSQPPNGLAQFLQNARHRGDVDITLITQRREIRMRPCGLLARKRTAQFLAAGVDAACRPYRARDSRATCRPGGAAATAPHPRHQQSSMHAARSAKALRFP